MAKSTGSASDVAGNVLEGIPALSPNPIVFVRHRPRKARLAISAVLETAAAQCEAEDRGVAKQLRWFGVRRTK